MTKLRKTSRHEISENEYRKIHYWLNTQYGRPQKCVNPDCLKISKYYSWALKNSCKYEKNIDNYIALCRSCHAKYDITDDGKKRIGIASREQLKRSGINPIVFRWGENHRETKACATCSKMFTDGIADKRKYCSVKCSHKGQSIAWKKKKLLQILESNE